MCELNTAALLGVLETEVTATVDLVPHPPHPPSELCVQVFQNLKLQDGDTLIPSVWMRPPLPVVTQLLGSSPVLRGPLESWPALGPELSPAGLSQLSSTSRVSALSEVACENRVTTLLCVPSLMV